LKWLDKKRFSISIYNYCSLNDSGVGSKLLDIVLISWNTFKLTVNCIDSIYKHTKVPFKVYLVDNASSDDTVKAVCETFPEVEIIVNNTNEGYAKAFNKGARSGHNPYILALNTDTFFIDKNWAQAMIKVFEDDPLVAAVSPRLINDKGLLTGCGVVGTNANPIVRGWMESNTPDKYNEQIECVSLSGAVMMIKRANIPVLGLFDEAYPFYYEETDYNFNARDKGFKVIYTPNTTVKHLHQGSSKNNRKLREYSQIGKRIFNRKWSHMMKDDRTYG
jgi:GT2 family glycosyltransferase